jgi:hypothetical protein
MINFITNYINFDNIFYISGITLLSLTGGSYLGFKYFKTNKFDKSIQTETTIIPDPDITKEYLKVVDKLMENGRIREGYVKEIIRYFSEKIDSFISLYKNLNDLNDRITDIKNNQEEDKVLLQSIKNKGKSKMEDQSIQTDHVIIVTEGGEVDKSDHTKIINVFSKWLYGSQKPTDTINDKELLTLPKEVFYDEEKMEKYLSGLEQYVNRSVGPSTLTSPITDRNINKTPIDNVNENLTNIIEEAIDVII